jgi:serine/threonine-protein kinase RsbW
LSEKVTIRIPASTAHVRLVRATASALAALLDFTYDRIMDLHIAIDEVCSRLLATSGPGATRLEITFLVEDGGLRIDASSDAQMRPGAIFLTTWSQAILESVVDHLQIEDVDGSAAVLFRVSRG